MRITNHFATQQAIASFTVARDQMNDAMLKATTGRRVRTASDDPIATRSIMQNDSEQRALTQRQRSLDAATARLAAEAGTLDGLTTIVTRAKELALSQGGDTANAASRKATAAEVNQLLAHAVQLANTAYEQGYLFGGHAGTAPFTIDTSGAVFAFAAAVPPAQGVLSIDIGAAQLLPTSHDGSTVFGDATSGALAALHALATALNAGDGAAVTATLPALDTSLLSAQTLTAEAGAWANRIDALTTAGRIRTEQLTADTSAVRDADVETAITELVGRQTAFQAAMAATARTFGMSLTDYL